jgi:osomolarity two-component system sensor histidine kinase TcsA
MADESAIGSNMTTDQSFFALTPIPTLLVDPALCIIQASTSFLLLHNLMTEECSGVNVYELFEAKRLDPEAAYVRHAIQTARATKKVYATEAIQAVSDRSTASRCWSLRAIPVFNEGTLIYLSLEFQDTARDRLTGQSFTDQLDTNDTYKILVQTVKDYAIFMLDTEGNVRTWNEGAAVLKGYSKEEIVGKHFSTFYTRDDIIAEKPRKELEICLREGKVEDESWRLRKDGTRFWANVMITTVYRNGIHIGFSKVTRDLSERRAAESRLISAYEEAAKLKSEFLANMSHEIRTPMHGMLSALALLMDMPLTAEQQELADIIKESGNVLVDVINDILDYSKLASGTISINSNITSIPDIINSVIRASQTLLKPEVSIHMSLDPKLSQPVQSDPLRYRQIVQNLVSNAVKFTESGSVHVQASITKEEDTSYTIRTTVTDTGIGISTNVSASLFTPFTQFDESATKRYRGTGLGLSISKSLTELMGGAIGFCPNPETRGSVFWFSVEVAKVHHADPATILEKNLAVTSISSLDLQILPKGIASSKRLLLAEDNPVNQKVMMMILKGLEFKNIDTALDGAQAVQLAKQNALLYDLILMDISMPVLDGVAATMEIRRAGLRIPIVAVTANALKGDVDHYLAVGMNDYVSKPVDRQILADVLIRWLK